MIKITFLSENKTDNPGCTAEFGLSVYIETDEMKILFDTGASDIFLNNAEECKVDLSEADALVISHGHYDHTEGVPAFCEVNTKAPIYIHEDAFGESHGITDGIPDKESCGILWDEETIEKLQSRFHFTEGPVRLTENIVISGTIPDIPGLEPTETFWRKGPDGEIVRDAMRHEQFLAVRNGSDGIYVFSGCSHKGVEPALKYAKALFPGEKIAGLAAGMHLCGASDEKRTALAEYLKKEDLKMVMPVHCTGLKALCIMKNVLGEVCIPAGCGDRYEF